MVRIDRKTYPWSRTIMIKSLELILAICANDGGQRMNYNKH